jgi:hypothetical protein
MNQNFKSSSQLSALSFSSFLLCQYWEWYLNPRPHKLVQIQQLALFESHLLLTT